MGILDVAHRQRMGGHRRVVELAPNRYTRLDVDGPELLARCHEDGADVAILVPNCPVCHQSTALAARALEESGIATVVMGCAKDIVEFSGVPRFVFSDFPLGNSAGRPRDIASQTFTLELALRLLESAPAARTTVQSPLVWSQDWQWKLDYCNAERLTPDERNRHRDEFDAAKTAANALRGSANEPALQWLRAQ